MNTDPLANVSLPVPRKKGDLRYLKSGTKKKRNAKSTLRRTSRRIAKQALRGQRPQAVEFSGWAS